MKKKKKGGEIKERENGWCSRATDSVLKVLGLCICVHKSVFSKPMA